MALTESYQPVYAGLDDEAMAKVGEFASSVLTACSYDDEESIHALIKQAMTDMSSDDRAVDLFFGTLHYAEEYGSPREKVAVAELLPRVLRAVRELNAEHELHKEASKGQSLLGKIADWRQNAGIGLGLGGLALGAAPYVSHVHRQKQRQGRIKGSLREVMNDHPELRQNPNSARYFQAIVDFAPDVAANSLVAGNVMKAMHQIGPSSVTPKMISELLQVQRGHDERPSSAAHAGEFGKHVGTFAKTVSGKK